MPSKYNIKCQAKGDYFNPGDPLEGLFVTSDGFVWPCCFYTSAWLSPEETIKVGGAVVGLKFDEYIMKLFEDDPDWNNCNVKPLDEILDHDFFMKYHTEENWASDTPPPMCVSCCNMTDVDRKRML